MSEEKPVAYEGWAILELMGHRRLAGYVSEAAQYGTAMIRIDVPADAGQTLASQFYGGSSIYCLTPTTEDIARRVAASNRPAPVHAWEMPSLPAPSHEEGDVDDDPI